MDILQECEMVVDEIEGIDCLNVRIPLSERRVKKRSKDQKRGNRIDFGIQILNSKNS
jgi:hypothetical protein